MDERAGPQWFIAIGASGEDGLKNIKRLLSELGSPKAIIMVVLHRAFDKPTRLRGVLQAATSMPVVIAGAGEALRLGSVYIGEPAAHLSLLASQEAGITEDRLRGLRNRTVDFLFKSIADHAGSHGIGVILSGALDDGSRGIEAIHHAGGTTMVLLRNPTHLGMPENAIAYDGPIDLVGSTTDIAARINTLVA